MGQLLVGVLRPVTGDQSWGSYMRFASNPNNSMFGQPMVYVEFISVTDVAECSSRGGEVELAISSAPSAAHRNRQAASLCMTQDIGLRPLT